MFGYDSLWRYNAKEGHGDLCFAPHDPIFYAGVLGRGWKETFDRSEPPMLLVTVGVNRYSHFFSRVMKNGPKTLHGLDPRSGGPRVAAEPPL